MQTHTQTVMQTHIHTHTHKLTEINLDRYKVFKVLTLSRASNSGLTIRRYFNTGNIICTAE